MKRPIALRQPASGRALAWAAPATARAPVRGAAVPAVQGILVRAHAPGQMTLPFFAPRRKA